MLLNAAARQAAAKKSPPRYAAHDVSLTPYFSQFASEQVFVVACPATEYWANVTADNVHRLVHGIGFDAMYLDQIASSVPTQCWDRSHGHPLGGGTWWTDGYLHVLRRAHAAGGGNPAESKGE